MSRKILTIGAYERDNFGDILFFLVLEYFAKRHDCELIAGSIFSSDMREYFGKYILPYHFLLSEYSFDAVWVVGGEMGACPIDFAVNMSINKEYKEHYLQVHSTIASFTNQYLVGGDNIHLAYLPYLQEYQKNRDVPLVINSVGGFEALSGKDDMLVENTIATLKRAQQINVRSRNSYEYLLSKGIQSQLNPDSVHALSFFYHPDNTVQGEYILVQINEHLFDVYGVDMISKSLYTIIQEYNCPVYLFSAGTANYHDSIEDYKDIQQNIISKYKENRVYIINEKRTLKRVDWIANAKIWIGSSLHGRIVASSYGVPRVSFSLDKVNHYAETWDSLFPYNITPETILDACKKALDIDPKDIKLSTSRLTEMAISVMEDAFDKLYAQ